MKITDVVARIVLTSGLYFYNFEMEEIEYGTYYEIEDEPVKRHLKLIK